MLTKLKMQRNDILKYLASFSLSTYIIHENSFIIRWIYRTVFRSDYYSTTSYFIINMFITIVSIFVICMIIEIIRRWIFKYTIDKLLLKSKIYTNTLEMEDN